MDKNQALDAVFNLKSVAIVGVAKGDEFNTRRLFLNHIIEYGFKGQVYLVNPKGGEVLGIKIHPQLKDIPGTVDYVISCIRAPLVPQLIKDSATKGVKAICVFTSGFSEFGTQQGRDLEREIQQLAQTTSVRIIGPNCLGIHSPKAGFSFVPDFAHEAGHVAYLCQSGGNTLYLVRAAAARGIRFSKVISYGNAADIDETDLLEYFRQDPETTMIAAYIEGVKDGKRFYRTLRKISDTKPVVILKGGRTQAGSTVAASPPPLCRDPIECGRTWCIRPGPSAWTRWMNWRTCWSRSRTCRRWKEGGWPWWAWEVGQGFSPRTTGTRAVLCFRSCQRISDRPGERPWATTPGPYWPIR